MAKVSLITIGEELLKGSIVNTNAAEMGKMLRLHGYTVTHTMTIGDRPQHILSAIETAFKETDIILMCGGLGPTEDDLTKQTLAGWFGSTLIMHQPSLERVTYIFRHRPELLFERNRNQALVPEGSEVLPNPLGTAPGLLFQKNNQLLIAMPGVPHEMRNMMSSQVIPRLKQDYPPRYYFQRVIRLADIGESTAAEIIAPILNNWPYELQLAYLPRMDGLWLEISGESPIDQKEQINKLAKHWEEKLSLLFPEHLYTTGDIPIEALLKKSFTERGLTLAVAESLTGGKVASTLISVSGSSQYIKGSVTAYATEIKIEVLQVPSSVVDQHSVISAQVAEAMAEGVRKLFRSDIGLSTTGLAEADGDQSAQAWLGYSDDSGNFSKHLSLRFKRNTNIEYVTKRLLLWAFQKLNIGNKKFV